MAAPGDDLAGRVLDGRYRLLHPIGTGASGRVYAADDLQLRRRVAVKVLHDALAADAGFLERFREEARTAAAMRHPNIMVVFDFGNDNGLPYMVMELLGGGSLRSMLDAGTRLSLAQAAALGRAVASALDYAHQRGIVHRDIKPANLLFDDDGVVRVADFGLARALAEASWTEPMGAMFGTARYSSPEQAMGMKLDSRSDLYALGLVLVEAVTGDLPWTADTPIGLLTVRTRSSMLVDPALGPLRAPLEQCGRLDRNERYPDAATLVRALDDALDALPDPAPFVLAGAIDAPDAAPTAIAAPAVAAAASALFDQDAGPVAQPPNATTSVTTETSGTGEDTGDETDDGSSFPPTLTHNDPRSRHGRARRRGVAVVVALALVAALGGSVVAAAGLFAKPGKPVPGLVGFAGTEASARARRAGFSVSTEPRTSDDPSGTVIAQSPAPGTLARDASSIRLVVSSGPSKVTVPTLVGQTEAAAAAQLAARGLIATPTHAFDDAHPETKGTVIVSERDGAVVLPDTEITYTVSDGHRPVAVPKLANVTWSKAVAQLRELGFVADRATDAFSSTVPAGSVIRTAPAGGTTQPYGATISVVVSKGPDLVTMPDVVGTPVGAACRLVRNTGLGCKVTGTLVSGNVASTSVKAGAKVARGTVVTVVVN